jgi:hypothetical protein
MKKPIKIIFDDDSEEDFNKVELFDYIDDDDIVEYAEWYLDMQQDYNIEEKEIEDFTTDEILDELFHRYKIHRDIISIKRFDEFLNNFYNL